jgi:hypothetical protein
MGQFMMVSAGFAAAVQGSFFLSTLVTEGFEIMLNLCLFVWVKNIKKTF